MKTKKLKNALLECSEIVMEIMPNVCKALTDNKIEYTHENQSEITIVGGNKKDIRSIITESCDIGNEKLKLLLQISESNNKVYIRQKFSK